MLKFYNAESWLNSFVHKDWFSTFHHPSFLTTHAEVYKVKPIYFTYSFKNDVVFAVSTFESAGKLIVPDHFLRTGFWINPLFGDIQVLQHLQEMLKILTRSYQAIRFNLPVEITDIRAFSWAGFNVKLMHTYEKDLTRNFDYHENVSRMIKKQDPGFVFSTDGKNFEKSLALHQADFYKFGIRKVHVSKYVPLLRSLKDKGYLLDLNLEMDNEVVASNFVLLNEVEKKAYVVLIAKSEKWYQYGTHAKIYDHTFNFLRGIGYQTVDLFGADVPGFALFKLKFGVQLKHHYQVQFDAKRNKRQKIYQQAKTFLKRCLN